MIRTHPRSLPAIAATGVAVAAFLASLAPVGPRIQVMLDNSAQLAVGVVATVACWITARGRSGPQRRWRRLMAYAMAGWSGGQLITAYAHTVGDPAARAPSVADVAFLAMPVFALPALLALGLTATSRPDGSRRRDAAVLALDGLIVVGSLFVLTWSTALGAVVRAGAPTPVSFAVAVAHPVADLVLVVIVVLLVSTRPVPAAYRPQLMLLGAGLVALSISDSVAAYRVAGGGDATYPLFDAGFVAGPVLIAAAALTRTPTGRAPAQPALGPSVRWLRLLLPYLPVLATGALILAEALTGEPIGHVEVGLAWIGLALVVARQVITLVDNTILLGQVSEGRRRLLHQAYHDPLTGLPNRALFRQRLEDAVARHRYDGRPLALIFIDLDDFKLLNDNLGHSVGDQLLRAVGERLKARARVPAVLARFGSDEFAVLLEALPGPPEEVGERILATLREPFTVDAHTVTLSASVGVVAPEGSETDLTVDSLLRRADAAVYVGKRRGKGVVVPYLAGVTDGNGDPDLPHLLAEALADDPAAAGFTVHYQPIVRLTDRAVVAVEALARWTHPVYGRIEPDVFVTVAERSGLVAVLDDFVLDRGCGDAAELAERLGRPVTVHVNVSAARLGRPELEHAVADAVARRGMSPDRLVLEITETSRICDLPAAGAAVRRLRATGVQIALDDFGSGFNALAQLHALPVDVVKLDSSLTGVEEEPNRAEALAGSVLRICADLGVAVVAEGVETVDQARALQRLGCQLGQGYLYGSPAGLRELTATGTAGGVQGLPAPRSSPDSTRTSSR